MLEQFSGWRSKSVFLVSLFLGEGGGVGAYILLSGNRCMCIHLRRLRLFGFFIFLMFSVERRFGPWWREPTENLQWWLQRVIWQLLVGLLGHYRHAGYLFLPIKFPEFVSKCWMLGSNHLTVICFKAAPKWCLLSTQCAHIRATCTHSHAFMQNFFLSRTHSWGCIRSILLSSTATARPNRIFKDT